ncbi:hypothetical protein L3556_02860 [Candidatus Synechococcus calcipolaris G9]|uniref:Uncharacterized protein n=1 Tax=Candidatus Synechococcus calcipolaris G9 TaxID=1497997 RepID=A0ABT6EVS7_9SYNE|nr:hypothetical protein [Candidatus Synechococcus calcipolaris]MDG2989880.1 hypothetical protein [Candidatus Synechococcus calcipolaris G9]
MRHLFSALIGLTVATGAIAPLGWAQLTPPAESETQPSRYQLIGVTFETPLTFSPPRGTGSGVAVVYPPMAAPGDHELMVSLLEIDMPSGILGELTNTELSSFLRYTGLGGAPARRPSMIERRIFGRRIQGEVFFKEGERPIYQELYLVRLSTGKRMAISLEAEERAPLALVEEVFSHVANSFMELPPRSREWRRSFEWHKHNSAQR